MDKVSILHRKLSEQEEYLAPHFREICYSAMEEYASLRISELEERIHKQNLDHVQLQQDWLVKLNEVSVLEERIKVLEGWINMFDVRYPELGVAVLVHLKSGYITVGYRKQEQDGVYWQLFGDVIDNHNKDQITHWKPLPSPPINNINN